MARRGRPSKYSLELHESICNDLKLGCSRTTAAEVNGLNIATLNDWAGQPPDWVGKYPDFSRDVAAAIAQAKRRATTTIVKAIQSGDVQSAFRYLAYQEREWREPTPTVNVNHTGEIAFQSAIEKVAKAEGLDPAEVLAEAQLIVAGGRE